MLYYGALILSIAIYGAEAWMLLYGALILSIAIYGAEDWMLRSQEIQSLEVFEMRCLRAIRGVTRADRHNIKIREDTFTPESITDVIRNR